MKATRSSNLALKAFRADDNKVVEVGGKANRTVSNLFKNKKFRNLIHMPNIEATEEPNFLTLNAKKDFKYLWLVFIKASIFQYFDLESHIQIEINISGYTINKILS